MMLGRMGRYWLAQWYAAWSARAEWAALICFGLARRWRTRSEKFFHRLGGGAK